jgi:hypothetical protein
MPRVTARPTASVKSSIEMAKDPWTNPDPQPGDFDAESVSSAWTASASRTAFTSATQGSASAALIHMIAGVDRAEADRHPEQLLHHHPADLPARESEDPGQSGDMGFQAGAEGVRRDARRQLGHLSRPQAG